MIKIYDNVNLLEDMECMVNLNLPVLLVGETGTGKTTLVKALCEKKSTTLTRINLNGET
jgi:midasin (ATPase involved in ribosome maturation)